ncbi:mannan endo-1,4-beta-mannosidase, partial [bacterium]
MLVSLLALTQDAVRLEAEDAARTGATVVTQRAGYSGRGYVTGFEANDAALVWMADIPKAGIYDARLRYATPGGYKEADLEANGLKTGIVLPPSGDAFTDGVVARLELTKGQNTLALRRGWGHYDIDWLELTPSAPPKMPRSVPAKPSDPNANAAARNLLSRLTKGYGKVMLSGQYDLDDTRYVIESTGKRPAIFGGDLMEFSPTRRERGAKVEGVVDG